MIDQLCAEGYQLCCDLENYSELSEDPIWIDVVKEVARSFEMKSILFSQVRALQGKAVATWIKNNAPSLQSKEVCQQLLITFDKLIPFIR